MRITLNETNRKPLVKLLSEFTGEKAKYLFTPTYAFQIGEYTVTREGNIDTPEGLDEEALRSLMGTLAAAGYQLQETSECVETESEQADAPANETGMTDGADAPNEPAENAEPDNDAENGEPIEAENSAPAVEEGAVQDEIPEKLETESESQTAETDVSDTETVEQPISLMVSVPLDKVNAGHLTSILDAKGSLIRKALGIPAMPIEITEDAVLFPWFSHTMDADTSKACTDFISALCRMSVTQKRVTAKEKEVTNEKYAFRCFLLRLGFIGPDYKTDRKILLRNLSGSAAFKSGSRNVAEGGDQNEKA